MCGDGVLFRKQLRLVTTLLTVLFVHATLVGQSVHEHGIRVEVVHKAHLLLHVTLESGDTKEVKITRDQLPWSPGHRMVIAVVMPTGKCLDRELPVQDPIFDEIILKPNTPMTDDIDLEDLFPGLKSAMQKVDLHLFWAYEAPEQLQTPRWSGGWILIPRKD